MSNPEVFNAINDWAAFRISDAVLFERLEQLLCREKYNELLEAARGVWFLIESGYLVRDISLDGEAGWAIKQLEPLRKLKAFESALTKAEAA